ncbi:MAG: efflux RND transporter periplasmic adaptor subunit [Thalassotalea sp.]
MKYLKFLLLNLFCFASWAQNYETTKVIVEPFSDTIQRSGKLAFKNTVLLTFKTNGYLQKLSVDEGDAFSKSQLLASLDITELLADKNSKFAQLLQAKRELKRAKQLLSKKLSSQQEVDLAETQLETARSAYQVVFYNLEKAELKAPFDGVVLSRHTDLGELQSPGKAVLRVAAVEKNWVVKVALTGAEINQVKLKQQVEVMLPGKGRIQGQVVKIPAIANTDGNLFLIDVLLPDLDLSSGVTAGQLAEVNIHFASEDFVYRLPIDALISVNDEGKAIILTKNDNDSGFEHKYFEVHKIDNQYVYLVASSQETTLQVVVRGWQHIQVEK